MRSLELSLKHLLFFVTIFCCMARPAAALDPAVAKVYLDQFKKNVGSSVETLAIMGGEDGASGGLYSFDNDQSDMSITKAGGRGIIGNPDDFDFSDNSIHWLPLLGGSIGYSEIESKFTNTPALVGNHTTYISFAMGFEAGARIYLNKELSIGPMLGFIYSHAHSSFNAKTPVGIQLKQHFDRQLVDWDMDTMSLVPSLDVQYEKTFAEDWRLTLSSRFDWFKTWDIAKSSEYLGLSGNSSTYWENKADLDIRLPIKVFNHALHTGGFVSAGVIGGDYRDVTRTDAMYTFNGRLVIGDITNLWKLNWIGLGASYIKSDTFNGLSWGIDARLVF